MFLCCIGLPDPETQFNGKGFLSPFAEMVPAVRDSKNRNTGTLEIKSINVTAAAVYLDKVIGPDGLLDTIKRNHPDWHGKRIIIQGDGASPHTGHHNIEKMNKAGKKDGWKIEFWTQDKITAEIAKTVHLLEERGTIFFRVNPGVSHDRPESRWIEFFAWNVPFIIELAEKFNLKVLDIRDDANQRKYFVYRKI